MRYPLKDGERIWAEETYAKIQKKLKAECLRVGSKIPYIVRNGVYEEDKAETDIIWWTNGFWPGMLWQMYHAMGEEMYADTAREVE